MKLSVVVFSPCDVTQPINEPVHGRIESIAHRQGNLSRVFAVNACLVHLVHDVRYLLDRGIIVLRGAREAQLDRTSGIARLVRVPRQTYHGRPVKGGFQQFRIGTMTQHHSGSAVTCNNGATVLKVGECARTLLLYYPRAIIQFNGALERPRTFARHVFYQSKRLDSLFPFTVKC